MNQVCHAITIYLDQTDNNPEHQSLLEETPSISSLEARLKTFDNWPNTQVSKRELALGGFEYTGQDDIVKCRFCEIEGYKWVSGDDPMADHREWNPSCPFLTTVESSLSESNRNTDTCGLYSMEVLPNSIPEDISNIQKRKRPHNRDKETFESRIATFENWPRLMKKRPAELAEAGFYYTGVRDQTLCFHCGGGLKGWEESDDPWEQHALWFNKCDYLKLKKGPDFVEKIQLKRDSQLVLAATSDHKTEELIDPEEPSSSAPKKVDKTTQTETSETNLCKICFQNELGVVFLPCRHIVACVDCACALRTCAVCGNPVVATTTDLIPIKRSSHVKLDF